MFEEGFTQDRRRYLLCSCKKRRSQEESWEIGLFLRRKKVLGHMCQGGEEEKRNGG